MDFLNEMNKIGELAVLAARQAAIMTDQKKNRCLEAIADQLEMDRKKIADANIIDLKNGKKNRLNGAMLDRLELTNDRLSSVIQSLHDITDLSDPAGKVDREFTLQNGLKVRKVRVPIGVIGIIYESRPNVTVDAAALCLKAGNAVVLRGGSESANSNLALARSMTAGLRRANVNDKTIQILPWTDREAVSVMVKMNDHIDLIIPRGGEGLIRFVAENATVPVIKHYKGVCHIYVDQIVNADMALAIIENAKCQRPGVCNAVETVLIHEAVADHFATAMAQRLRASDVELRGDPGFLDLVKDAVPATEDDWHEEYLDKILSVKIVPDIGAAIDHIATYGSGHSDAIVSDDETACDRFLREVDSAAVYVNASTRFTDGGQFGMGAEIGISTDRIHARGPMGLEELTTYKYVVLGTGQIRE